LPPLRRPEPPRLRSVAPRPEIILQLHDLGASAPRVRSVASADLATILRYRGETNRLGYGLMLCCLNSPGRALRAGEQPPAALIGFIAEQIGGLPQPIDEYLVAERNCWRHSRECRQRLGLRPFGKRTAAELMRSRRRLKATARNKQGDLRRPTRSHRRIVDRAPRHRVQSEATQC
jgi:hypothetical protein